MQGNNRWGFSTAVVGAMGLGWALQCQTPRSHVQVGMGDNCATCHQSDFQSAAQPLHVGLISEDCAQCHSNTAWAPARGSDHSFPLEGAHTLAACNTCHTGEPPLYEGTATTCLGCHASQRDQVLEPSHADFSDDCQSCHSTQAWQPAGFDHEWPLTGAHAATACTSCHTGDPPVYGGTPEQCADCHRDDRSAVTQPSHDGFSEDCGSCHGASAWRPAAFPEHEWPLTGAHAVSACSSCHTGDPPVYDGTPERCIDCHASDRASVVEPPHAAFSEACDSCHSTASWDSASFEHTFFELTGAHQAVDCGGCHTGAPAVFAGTARECVGCHQADYDTSPFPGHSEFSTSCQDCHVTDAWVPASGGNHPQDRFSITGTHAYACNECHNPSLGPNGAGNSDCVGCHEGEHTLARMDGDHDEVGDYPRGGNRAPNFCLQCHANGRE